MADSTGYCKAIGPGADTFAAMIYTQKLIRPLFNLSMQEKGTLFKYEIKTESQRENPADQSIHGRENN